MTFTILFFSDSFEMNIEKKRERFIYIEEIKWNEATSSSPSILCKVPFLLYTLLSARKKGGNNFMIFPFPHF
jgi:hypothetical protein